MDIIRSKKPAQAAADALSGLLNQYRDTTILLLLSGGSWLDVLDLVDVSVVGPHCTITVLDERFSVDETVNNFLQLTTRSFFKQAHARGCSFISTQVLEDDSPESLQLRWDFDLKKWYHENPGGVVLATVGIGSDGHIAGIFPGVAAASRDDENWTQTCYLPAQSNPYHERVSVTRYFLVHMITSVVVYAVGIDKKLIIEQIIQKHTIPKTLPVGILHDMKSVSFFTDV